MPNELLIRNPESNRHYAKSENVITVLDTISKENIEEFAMPADEAIDMTVSVDTIRYVKEQSTATTKGRLFTERIYTPNTLRIKEVI